MKIVIDILLFIFMILEFSRMYMPTILHEIIGISLLVLVVVHIILNRNYIKNIFGGRYSLKRIIMLVINSLFMITFFLSILFGILSSQDLFRFLNIGNINIINFHKIFSYISLICMAIHLGINFKVMFGYIEKKIKNKMILYLINIIIILLGIYSWNDLEIWNHLTGSYGFSIVTSNLFINILEYLSIVMMFTIITNIIYKKN